MIRKIAFLFFATLISVFLAAQSEALLCAAAQQGKAGLKQVPPAGTTKGQDEAEQDEVIKVDTTLITVPVSVLDRDGRFISDLLREDFHVYEDGIEQQLAFFAPVERAFSVVLLIDTSPSTRTRQKEIREAALSFIDQLRPEDNVMVVAFDSRIRVLSKATKDREDLRKAVRNLQWDGSGTLLYGTVDALFNRFFRRLRGRKALVMLTDGQDGDPRGKFTEEVSKRLGGTFIVNGPTCDEIPCATYQSNMRDAEELDALIYPIKYEERIEQVLQDASAAHRDAIRKGYDTSDTHLRGLAQKTGGRFYSGDGQDSLVQIFSSIANELRHQYSLGYYAKSSAQPGQRRQIKVRVARPNLVVRARTSYISASNK